MRTVRPIVVLAAAAMAIAASPAPAQEFGVYTRVLNLNRPAVRTAKATEPSSNVLGRSLSLFHAGKVYDTIYDAGEVTIFEPARRRFIVLNGPKRLTTEVSFDEITRSLEHAAKETRLYVAELREQGDRTSAVPLLAQLEPGFQARYDKATRRLILTGRYFRYHVRCAADNAGSSDPARFDRARDRYLDYADWTARLNYLLHPNSLYPAPRLALDSQLRQRRLLPVQVDLMSATSPGMHLRAEHQYHWTLTTRDRDDIQHWESLLAGKRLRRVKFAEYRKRVVGSR